MVQAYMRSLLVHQFLFLQDEFARRYSHPWLVWEPTRWTPSPGPAGNRAETILPGQVSPGAKRSSDALCFALGGGAGDRVRVGRAEENEITINDATLSRTQLILCAVPSGWAVELVADAQATSVDGLRLEVGRPVCLSDGARLDSGGVQFTYHDGDGFLACIRAAAPHVTPGR